MQIKTKIYNECIFPKITYETETWIPIKKKIKKYYKFINAQQNENY